MTSLEFERHHERRRPDEGHSCCARRTASTRMTIVFIQCVGSRDTRGRGKGKPYCSKICCMYTAKHAMLVREKYPDAEVHVFYIDVRTPGKNFDEFYRRAVEQYDVDYIKGMVGKVCAGGRHAERAGHRSAIDNEQVHIDADMVVLAAAIEPDPTARALWPPC